MEQFGARKSNPLTTCLEEVEQSDIYVGIIGMRFGSEEPKSKKSYTQLEYEKAVDLNKDILIYLLDETNSTVTPSLIQFDKFDKLKSFKSILKDKHTIDTFSNSGDLVEKLKRRFNALLPHKPSKKPVTDEYKNTQDMLKLFFLAPKAYSGREIKLKVKFINSPLPVSKPACEYFNFEFGQTILNEIKVILPIFEYQNFTGVFIEFNLFDAFLNLDKSIEHEIIAKLLFNDVKTNTLTTDFRDRINRVYNYDDEPNYDYDSEPPMQEEYYDVFQAGDGQIALSLKQILPNLAVQTNQ